MRKAKSISEKYSVPFHIHLSETQWEVSESRALYGKRPVVHLDSIGCLDETVLAVHCTWVDGEEIELIARRGTSVSHCMESNLKLASGFAPVAAMLSEGINVTFGTDGAAFLLQLSNELSLFSFN